MWYYKHYRCFLNLLSPIYYHSPNLNICCKTLQTLLTIKFQRVFKKLFKRISITWYFKNGINVRIDKFFWGGENLPKKDILFFPQYIVRSNHRKVLYEVTVLNLWSKTSIANIWNKPKDDHTQKVSRRTNKLISTFCKNGPPQKCHVNVIWDTVM